MAHADVPECVEDAFCGEYTVGRNEVVDECRIDGPCRGRRWLGRKPRRREYERRDDDDRG
jgi:hypothetical protein